MRAKLRESPTPALGLNQARWPPCFFSCCSPFFLAMLVHLCWGPVAQSLVRPLPVVELQVGI